MGIYIKTLVLLLLINFCRAIDLNILLSTIEPSTSPFQEYVDSFNHYSKQNNLDINLELKSMTTENFSLSIENSNMMFDSLVKKKRSPYDIYIYDAAWTRNYCPYFIDLKEHLDKENINLFDKNIISQLSLCGDKLIGMPIKLAYEVLYSNKALLEKYDKEVPKTWQQLYETGKEIIEQEKAEGNVGLVGYNGVFGDAEMGVCSVYELMYSSRKTCDSPLPEFTSPEAVEAAILMKKIKEEVSSDDYFKYPIENTVGFLQMGNALFVKFFVHPIVFMIPNFQYKMSNLPGMTEDVTGTILTGYNVGILNNISKEKLKSAMEVIKFFILKDTQKQFVLQRMIISAISSIYEDDEFCAILGDCELYRDPQPIVKPVDVAKDFNQYATTFTNYFYEYLYGDKDISTALKSMGDLTKIYKVDIDTKETSIGLITVIVFSITMAIMLSSLLLLIPEKNEKLFIFLPKSFWCLVIFGILCISSVAFTKLGDVTSIKCHMNNILFSIGYVFIYTPILFRLLIAFPEENKISKWINDNKYIFISIIIFINLVLNGFTLIKDYGVENIILNEGENFQKCDMDKKYSLVTKIIVITYNVALLLLILVLMFVEWNLKHSVKDLRFIMSSIYMNIITFGILSIFNYFNIRNYKLYFGLYVILVYILSLVNYITLYGIRILLPKLINKDDIDILKFRYSETDKKSGNQYSMSCDPTSIMSSATTTSRIATRNQTNSLFSRALEYHNQVE